MALPAELIAMMPHTVAIAPYSSQSKYGEPTYGAGVNYTAMVEQKARQVRDIDGQERVSMTTIYLNTTAAITPRDKLTLPSGFVPQIPPIINVHRLSDESG